MSAYCTCLLKTQYFNTLCVYIRHSVDTQQHKAMQCIYIQIAPTHTYHVKVFPVLEFILHHVEEDGYGSSTNSCTQDNTHTHTHSLNIREQEIMY